MNPTLSVVLIQSWSNGFSRRLLAPVISLAVLLAARLHANETNNLWNATNGISSDIYWSDANNWLNTKTNGGAAPAGIPQVQGDVTFGNNGGTLEISPAASTGLPLGSVLSTVGGGMGAFTTNNLTCILTNNQTIHWLFMCPTNNVGGVQNLFIGTNATLTVQGTDDNGMGPLGDYDNAQLPNGTPTGGSLTNEFDTLYVGRQGGVGASGLAALPTQVTISGGGTLFLNNTNNQMQVRDANSSSGAHVAFLDMSALANFKANLARIKIGMGEQNSLDLRASGCVYLAQTNTLVLGGTNTGELDNLVFAVNPQNNNNNPSQLYWGMTNGIFADTILLGGRKSGNNTNMFNPAFANLTYTNTQPTPTAYFRNSKSGPVNLFRIGDESDGSGAGTAGGTGVINWIGGTVDVSANTMIVGKLQTGGGGGGEVVNFLVGDGTLNLNTLTLCSQTDSHAAAPNTVGVLFEGTQVTITNLLQLVVPFTTVWQRTLNLGLTSDPNGVPASLTTLGSVTTGFITPHNLKDSIINYGITNSTLAMVNPQPIEASTMILDGGTISNASYVLITGFGATNNLTENNAYGNSLTILDNGRILGNPIYDLGVRTATWDVSGMGGASPGTLVVSNLLEGIGTIDGSVVQAPGATIQVGEGTVAGTLNIANGNISNSVPGNLTLNAGNLQFGLSASGSSGNDSINVAGTLNLLGTNSVTLTSLSGSFDTVNPYTLISTPSALPVNAANYFKASGALGGSRYILTFDTTTVPNNVLLRVSGSGSANDTWVGGLNGNAWDVKTTANWTGGQFFDLDNVTFNDSGSASPAVNTSGSALIPGSMTVGTTNNNYGFAGTGSILVGGAFTANGTGGITFTNSGGVTFQDALTIASNAVTFGGTGQFSITGDPNSQVGLTLNGGSLTFAGNSTVTFVNPVFAQILNINAGTVNIVNSNANVFSGSLVNLVNPNSDFVFGQPAGISAVCDAVFSGSGQIIQNGPGLISLAGANSQSGVTLVNGGTLQAQNGTALGSAGVIVAPGATLDVYGNNLGALPVTASGLGVGGQGAVVSSSGTGGTFTGGLTLLANTSVGGNAAWSYDPVQNHGLFAIGGTLSASATNGTTTNAFNLVKVGGNEVQYNFSTVDPLLANIDVQSGMLYLENSGGLGDPAKSITVESGAVLALAAFADSTLGVPTKNWILNGDGSDPTLLDYAITKTTIAGPVTLNGACIMSAAPNSRVSNGNTGVPGGVEIQGPMGGSGSFNLQAVDTWILDATNTYSGNTTISGGGVLELSGSASISNSPVLSIQNGSDLDASERGDQTFTLYTGQTLTTLNGGYVNGNLVVNPGATLAPGGILALDQLSVSNENAAGNVTLNGITSLKLEPLLAGSGVDSDELNATNGGQVITFGGTLQLSNFGGTYAVGQTFQLFNAATYQGTFSNIVPATPGSGLAWATNQLSVTGELYVTNGVAAPLPATIRSTTVSGGNLILAGNGGADGGQYVLLTSTSLALPLSSWTRVITNNFAGDGSFSQTAAYNAGDKSRFYIILSQ